MKEMSCCFIGHRKITISKKLKTNLINILKNLITQKNVKNFLFGDRSAFNNFCLDIVSNLKDEFPFIKLISYPSNDWYRGEEKENVEFNKRVLNNIIIEFDDYKYLDYYGKFSYVQRNEKMINDSDFCIFYYDVNYKPQKNNQLNLSIIRKSGTEVALNYAKQKNKKIINIKNLT